MQATIQPTEDFDLTGNATNPNWQRADWLTLSSVKGPSTLQTRAKLLYSTQGLYILFDCQDEKITATPDEKFPYTQDVVEIFLQPNETQNLYIEYELSPLNRELLLLVPNNGHEYHGWQMFYPMKTQQTRHVVTARGGKLESGAAVEGWSAEMFLPWEIFIGFAGAPPTKGSRWRGNLYRIDYDHHPRTLFAWCKDTGPDFHDMKHFGWFVFD